MTDLFTYVYPDRPGWKARDTSIQAAEDMTPRAVTLRDGARRAIEDAGRWGRTADEAATALGRTVLAIRPRVTELAALGLIRDSGLRRANASGKPAIVWVSQ